MSVATIKKSITKGEELVVMPRREYEELISANKEKNDLDKELLVALKEVRQGKLIGPFTSATELKKSLEK